jgi:beta-N-acetylglucosaminidase
MKKASLLMWLLMPIMLVTTPQTDLLAPPLTEGYKQERMIYMNTTLKELVYNEGITNYINYVGTKYEISNSIIFNETTIRLMLDNSKTYPSVVVAMAILETGWGKYAIGNNYFGIKGKGHRITTKEWNGKEFITIKDNFQQYNSLAESIRAHSKLLHSNLYKAGEATSYQDVIDKITLGKFKYATDPGYANKLNQIIKLYDLTQLDELKILYNSYVI